MPKPWEPQTRQQIETEIRNLSGRLVRYVAEETFKYYNSFPKNIQRGGWDCKCELPGGPQPPAFKEGMWGGHSFPPDEKTTGI
jgi:hypothetical protein